MHQLMESQKKSDEEINTKLDNMYYNLDGRIENVSTHVKILENQLAKIASKSRAPVGVLPGKSEGNPKERENTIEFGPWFTSAETDWYMKSTDHYTYIFNRSVQPLHRSIHTYIINRSVQPLHRSVR